MEPITKRQVKLDKISKKRITSKTQVLKTHVKQSNDHMITEKDSNIQIQYIDLANQQFYVSLRLKKAKQWWKSIDMTYFKQTKLKNILFARDLSSPEKIPDFCSSQSILKDSYENEEIFPFAPHLTENTLINVVFKSSNLNLTNLVSFSFGQYFNKRAKISNEQIFQTGQSLGCEISSYIQKPQEIFQKKPISEEQVQEMLKCSNLEFDSILTDKQILSKIQRVQSICMKMRNDEEIDQQLQMWKEEAITEYTQNNVLWNNLIENHSKIIESEQTNFQTEIITIKQSLMHCTILRYMEHGTRDKTQEMFKQLLDNLKLIKPAKTRELMNKKFFETDCKICFCSFNYDSNQVLYCDMCNTSFHLACYGLHDIPQEKEYFCDQCTVLKKQEKAGNNLKKLTCQICCKPNFPIKNIDGHFYHMTCLILLNFSKFLVQILVTIKNQKIHLRQGINHSNIIKRVIESELQCGPCVFCLGSSGEQVGMQFKCSVFGCKSSMHPICAYINGCKFSLKKIMGQKRLQVDILCNKHDCDRDYIQQTYLRRYMCNFKNTSQKSLQSFTAEYQKEIFSRKLKNDVKKQNLPNIIIDTKVIRKYIGQKQQKKTQRNQDVVNTQTRKIFQKLVKNSM